MNKAGSGPRREGWRKIRSVLLAPPVIVIVVLTLLFVIALFVALSAGSHALGIHTDGELMGFILGFLIAGFLGTIWYLVATLSGGADWITGARAERWTSKELSRLGPDWRQFSNVPFSDGGFGIAGWQVDVDHVVVGPYGVLVVESKYCSSPVDLGSTRLDTRVSDAVRQAGDNSGQIRALLQRDAPDVPIRPVVVFWGRLVKPPAHTVRKVGQVRIVHGGDAKKWLPLLTVIRVLSEERTEMVAAKVAAYQSRHSPTK
jgi:hypothetical protein